VASARIESEADVDIIRFIADLRGRSRWLTYTYVLTNLISHLSQTLQPQQAESEARNALNRLVQQNVLKIDREPREIEVAGARHRVRMCHLEESNPAVQAVLAGQASQTEPVAGVVELAPTEPARSEAAEAPAAAPILPFFALPPLPDALLAPSTPAAHRVTTPAPAAAEVAAPAKTPAPVEPAEAPTAPAEEATPTSAGPAAEAPEEPAPRQVALAEAFGALREVVREATGPEKPLAGAASVKTRLSRRLGSFDERAFGFSKFKDFLLAAQRDGFVRVESQGPATRVALPAE
jgi:hypothetical protein